MAEEKTTEPLTPTTKGAPKKAKVSVDLASVGGLVLALLGILGGLMVEGGKLKDIAQFTAAMIVLGGTFGAVLVSTPLHVVMGALRRVSGVFVDRSVPLGDLIDEVIGYATKARQHGLVSLEQAALLIEDPFLQKALNLAVDGTDLQEIRGMLALEIELEEGRVAAEARVFECAGGYAPTIGIIGAVLGLIQVMKNLANIDEVGHGIAVAFVATVYGVASANLLFLPAASKITAREAVEIQRKELIVEAVAGIVEGLNPKVIRLKLEAYAMGSGQKAKSAKAKPQPEGAPVGSEA
jgi:chemotaxis protein MotA